MGDIVTFKSASRSSIVQACDAPAQILWFTGVRYVRIEKVEDAAVTPPPRVRAKRTPSRRPRASVVNA